MKIKNVSLILALSLLTSCGAYFEDKDESSNTSTNTGSPSTGGGAANDLVYQDSSVNSGSVVKTQDETEEEVLSLRVLGGAFAPGSYNGGGTGSKAVLGVDNFNGTPLADFESVQYDSRSRASFAIASILYLNMQVDLKCDGTKVKILAADPEYQSTPLATDAEGYSTYRIESSDDQWRAGGGIYYTEGCDLNGDDDCTDAGEAAPVQVMDDNRVATGPLHSLDYLLSFYPDACLIATQTGDGGLPAGEVTSSFMFAVGSSGTQQPTSAEIKNIEFNGEAYDF